MTLPASPPISLIQIQDEYGAPRGTGLTSFYRGGAFVPNTAANSGVPTSGNISLLNFLGQGGGASPGTLTVSAPGVFSQVPTAPAGGSSTAVASGGSGTKSYAWTLLSGVSSLVSGSSSATATFQRNTSGTSESVYRVTVTDSSGTAFDDISVILIVGDPI